MKRKCNLGKSLTTVDPCQPHCNSLHLQAYHYDSYLNVCRNNRFTVTVRACQRNGLASINTVVRDTCDTNEKWITVVVPRLWADSTINLQCRIGTCHSEKSHRIGDWQQSCNKRKIRYINLRILWVQTHLYIPNRLMFVGIRTQKPVLLSLQT